VTPPGLVRSATIGPDDRPRSKPRSRRERGRPEWGRRRRAGWWRPRSRRASTSERTTSPTRSRVGWFSRRCRTRRTRTRWWVPPSRSQSCNSRRPVYTVILDGHLFPNGLQGLAEGCALRGIAVHYAVLRTDLATCIARRTSEARAREEGPDAARRPNRPVLRASRPFSDLGGFEANVIEAAGAPDGVAAAVLAAFHSGRLVATVRAGSPDT